VSELYQALQLISIGILPRGSAVFLEQPSYLYSLHVFQSAGIDLVGLPMDNRYNFEAKEATKASDFILHSMFSQSYECAYVSGAPGRSSTNL
jgi:hypothetical protein